VRKILLFSGIILLVHLSYCQTEKKNFLMLEVGPAFPVGSLSHSNYDKENPGFAVTGLNLKMSYLREWKSRWGYLVMLRVNTLPLNDDTLLKGFALDDTWTISTTNYNMFGLYGGFSYALIDHRKFKLQIIGMVGLSSVAYPTTTIKHPMNVYFLSVASGDNSFSFSYNANSLVSYYLSPKVSLSASFGYMHTLAWFDTEWSTTFDYQTWSGKSRVKQPISLIDLAVGLTYKL